MNSEPKVAVFARLCAVVPPEVADPTVDPRLVLAEAAQLGLRRHRLTVPTTLPPFIGFRLSISVIGCCGDA